MSSTNRGGQRVPDDNYETPAWCVERILEQLELPGQWWLDPCAGTGAIIRAASANRPDLYWGAVELRKECEEPLSRCATTVRIADFGGSCSKSIMGKWDVILTNPPYNQAEQFIEMCLPLATWTVMLLRLNYLGSEKRSEFLRAHTPDVYVLPNRPSFGNNKLGKRGTDSTEYAWFVWHGPRKQTQGKLIVLESTPKAQRIVDQITTAMRKGTEPYITG